MNNLAICYMKGQGVSRDVVQAYKWFYLASARGYAEPRKILPELVKSMTPDQIAEAQTLAREWKMKLQEMR